MAQERGVAYEFWLKIENERVTRNWTQVELAKRAGLPTSTLNRLKMSTRKPYASTVARLADALNLDRTEAARLAGIVPNDNTPDLDDPHPDDEDLLADIDAINQSEELPAGVKAAMIRELERIIDRQRRERADLARRQDAERREAVAGWLDIARSGIKPA
jgi:transcriptional regulator with XRE-family HTH domain